MVGEGGKARRAALLQRWWAVEGGREATRGCGGPTDLQRQQALVLRAAVQEEQQVGAVRQVAAAWGWGGRGARGSLNR